MTAGSNITDERIREQVDALYNEATSGPLPWVPDLRGGLRGLLREAFVRGVRLAEILNARRHV